jgi:hypothetical protein
VRKRPLLALHPTEREEISWGLTEQLSVNQFVVGSIPTAGANSTNYIRELRDLFRSLLWLFLCLEALRKGRVQRVARQDAIY